MLKLALVSLLVPLNGCVIDLAGECRHSADRSTTISAAGIETVAIRAAAGSLSIVGESGSDQIRVEARACASRSRDLDEIELLTDREGNEARIEASIDSDVRRGRLDLRISLPDRLAVEVDDSSGDADIRGVSSLLMRDGSGDIEIYDVAGEVAVEDGSGDLWVSRSGSLLVLDDGSGDIEIESIRGDVVVRDDGSGDIDVVDVGGDLRIGDSGSGDVDYERVAGSVDVR
jgi:DUF4097 and DUF4098 domain-containing protein YvlB